MSRLSLIVPLALMLGALSACGPDQPIQIEMRNHAGAPYSFIVERSAPPLDPELLADYDIIPLPVRYFLGRIEHGGMVPFQVKPPEDESSIKLIVSVFPIEGESESEPGEFAATVPASSRGTHWLDYVVKDGVFKIAQGRD